MMRERPPCRCTCGPTLIDRVYHDHHDDGGASEGCLYLLGVFSRNEFEHHAAWSLCAPRHSLFEPSR
jgi:hypothetical protein